MRGERLWATGQPSTPSRVRRPVGPAPAALGVRIAISSGSAATVRVLAGQVQELGVGRGKGGPATTATRKEEQVVGAGGVCRGLKRGQPPTVDRGRGQ